MKQRVARRLSNRLLPCLPVHFPIEDDILWRHEWSTLKAWRGCQATGSHGNHCTQHPWTPYSNQIKILAYHYSLQASKHYKGVFKALVRSFQWANSLMLCICSNSFNYYGTIFSLSLLSSGSFAYRNFSEQLHSLNKIEAGNGQTCLTHAAQENNVILNIEHLTGWLLETHPISIFPSPLFKLSFVWPPLERRKRFFFLQNLMRGISLAERQVLGVFHFEF